MSATSQLVRGVRQRIPVARDMSFAGSLISCERTMPPAPCRPSWSPVLRPLALPGVETRAQRDMEIRDTGRAGIMFEGDQGRLFVNRGTLAGKPVEQLQDNSLPETDYQLYAHDDLRRERKASNEEFELSGNYRPIANHVANFLDCIRTKNTPISDVVSQHRSVSTCHLVNISIRLGRKLTRDPERELCVGDDEANRYLTRAQRKGFEIVA